MIYIVSVASFIGNSLSKYGVQQGGLGEKVGTTWLWDFKDENATRRYEYR